MANSLLTHADPEQKSAQPCTCDKHGSIVNRPVDEARPRLPGQEDHRKTCLYPARIASLAVEDHQLSDPEGKVGSLGPSVIWKL